MIKVSRPVRNKQRYNIEHLERSKNSMFTRTTMSVENLGPVDLVTYLAKAGVSDDHVDAAYRSLKRLKSKSVYFNTKLEFFYAGVR